MRTTFLSSLLLALVLFAAAPAPAQTPAEIAEIVAVQGYYVEPGSEPVSEAELIELASTMQDRGYNFVPVVLADDPSGGAPAFASAIVDQFSVGATVVVLTPSELA